MEKKISLTRSEIVKWVVFLASIISVFLAMQYRVGNLADKCNKNERDNIELRQELKELKQQMNTQGKEISLVNGKLDEIKTTVNSIADAIFKHEFNPGSAR